MFRILSYTTITVLSLDLLATTGDITWTWTSPIFPKLQSNDSDVNPFGRFVSDDEESWIGALISIGAMIGPLPYGFIAERFGRKVGLLAVAIPHIISYLMLAFSQTVYLYYFARLLGGIAVGGGYTLLPTYIAEATEDSNRGMFSVTLNIFWAFGSLLPYIIGPFISILWFNVILACVPVAFFISFFFLAPETPYYLVSKNKIEEAQKSLMLLRSKDKNGVEEELKHIRSDIKKDKDEGNFLDLFRSRIYLKGLMISLTLQISQQLSGINAVAAYSEDLFTDAGVEGVTPVNSSIIVGVFMFASTFITPFFADKTGRRPLLLISYCGTTVAHAAFGVYFYLKNETDVDVGSISWLPILSMVFYIISFNIGLGAITWTMSSELFPTCVKSYSASIVSITTWITSFFVTKFFNDMLNGLGYAGTFWLFGGCCFAGGIFTFFFVPETKGKSFQEIQELL